jgi:hypothetical protein
VDKANSCGSWEEIRRISNQQEWFSEENQSGSYGEPLNKEQIATKYGVCLSTFEKYTCKDVSKRQKLGTTGDRKSVVSENTFEVIYGIVIKQANDGNRHMATENINKIMVLEPQLSRKQAAIFYSNTFMIHEETEQMA